MINLNEDRKKKEKLLKRGLIILGIIIILLLVLYFVLSTMDSQRNKIYLNNTEVSLEQITYDVGNKTYVDIKQMCSLFPSFEHNKGEYKIGSTINLEKDYFYLKSPYEVIQFKENSKKFTKTILIENNYYQYDNKGNRILTDEEKRSGNESQFAIQEIDKKKRSTEEFELSAEAISMDGLYFIPLDSIKYVFNVQYTKTGNKLSLFTVEYLEKAYAGGLTRAGLSLNPNYQNRKAIIDGYFITTKTPDNPVYGVYTYKNGFDSMIGDTYSDVRYVQVDQNMFVIDRNNQIGLINLEDFREIIKPGKYKSIESYLPDIDIYMVQNENEKFGLIDVSKEEVKPIIHNDYDEIGFDVSKFMGEKTGKIFFDNLIPVRKNNKWFIFDLKNPNNIYGQNINGYEGLGYIKPELIILNSYNQPQLTDSQKEELIARGLESLTRPEAYSDQATNTVKLKLLAKEGYVTDQKYIPDGESVLTIPEDTGYGGLVVKMKDSNGEYIYQPISSDINKRKDGGNKIYSIPVPYKRIYRIPEEGIEKYFVQKNDGTTYEIRKETVTNSTN